MRTVGNFTRTESRETTEMLMGKWTSMLESGKGYSALAKYLSKEELRESDRWFDLESDEEGNIFATTGTVDLEYYIQVENK